jgi:hypothetical protein
LDVGENTNFPLPKDISLGTLAKIVVWLRKVCNFFKQSSVKGEKKKNTMRA